MASFSLAEVVMRAIAAIRQLAASGRAIFSTLCT
jgi:hypothetical protein